ncbi:MAG: hypothetical protein HY700_07505 [Gemmatimonadetes bacterium]|nr:hypothetical protein [Gemmatimonadota bacterium]
MREIIDPEGRLWIAEIISHGRTSDYLNPKVHRPVVQFSCKSSSVPRRYVALPVGRDALEVLSEGDLLGLLNGAREH